MTTDLWMLVATSLLCLLIPVVYAVGRFQSPGGFNWALGNRPQELKVSEWTVRAQRAHRNLLENIGPFAIFVILAQITGKADASTALGATIFFWGRVAHLVVYVSGIKYLRTLVWVIAWIGGFMVLARLFH